LVPSVQTWPRAPSHLCDCNPYLDLILGMGVQQPPEITCRPLSQVLTLPWRMTCLSPQNSLKTLS
jgi:hypothetical protein